MIFLTPYMTPCNFLWESLDGPPPQDLAPNKIVFRLVFRPKLAQTVTMKNTDMVFFARKEEFLKN